jgi:formylglycine-generating enzyme required for sulfatase activity
MMVALLWCAAAPWQVKSQERKVTGQRPGAPPREFTNSVGMRFVWIEPGSFQMGSETGNPDERPVHEVRLSKGFYLQVTEVTQRQWEAVMGSNPSNFKGPNRPVEDVSWGDAQEFLRRLNEKEKDSRYRLPTEAEWEGACRAGGQEPGVAADLDEVAWWWRNSDGVTHAVGQKKPNAWGLFDMRGNVWEWVQDWYGAYSVGRQIDPRGPDSGEYRVLRGGSWLNDLTDYFRCAPRSRRRPTDRLVTYGFRCARTL